MSDEQDKPLLPSEFLKAHKAAGGWENDDAVMEVAGRAFFPEKCDPPAPAVKEVIPEGFVKAPDFAAYEQKRKEKDFENVRERMRQTLSPAEAEAANTDFDTFNFEYDRTAEAMRQESEARVAKAVEMAKAQLAQKEREKKILANVGNGDFRTMDQAAKIAERFLK